MFASEYNHVDNKHVYREMITCIKTWAPLRETERCTQCTMYAKRAIYAAAHVCVMPFEYEHTGKLEAFTL